MRALCGLNVIPHWLNTSSTLAVQKICNGNKYMTPKYKYKYKYQVPHLCNKTSENVIHVNKALNKGNLTT